MSLDPTPLLSSLLHSRPSTAIRESTWAVMALEAVHLIGLTLLGGPAVIVGLSALRRSGLRGLSTSALSKALLPVLAVGLALMAASGTLIAISMPFKYYLNAAFRVKMGLLVVALIATARLFQDAAREPLPGARKIHTRRTALVALLLWFGVGLSGRLIGFL